MKYWKVIEFSHKDKHGHKHFICQCKCGTIKTTLVYNNIPVSESCGCKRKENKGQIAKSKEWHTELSQVIARYKIDARNRSLPWSLTREESIKLLLSNCFYCDISASYRYLSLYKKPVIYTGIDRVDNNKGYHSNNCVSCCSKCNNDKKSVTPLIIKKAYEFLYGKV